MLIGGFAFWAHSIQTPYVKSIIARTPLSLHRVAKVGRTFFSSPWPVERLLSRPRYGARRKSSLLRKLVY